jgi:hypothetical protein
MDKIKEVQQILNNHALPTNNGGFIRDSLDGSKFNEIAQDIVKSLNKDNAARELLIAFAEFIDTDTLTGLFAAPEFYVDRFLNKQS